MTPEPNSASPAHEELLRHHYRWMRAGMALFVVCIGLLATLAGLWIAHPSLASWKDWDGIGTAWLAGIGASVLAGVALWLLRRWSLRETAQRVDERLQSMNRLETATQFSKINDPLLRAQRQETAYFLGKTPAHRKLRRFPWMVVALWILLLGHAATWLIWARPWVRPVAPAVAVAPKPTPAPLPVATIHWVTPKSETQAAPIEEVPLEANADSAGGLQDMTLKISVNGEQKLVVPVSAAELAQGGAHKIDTSIYLDQLNVQPFDMVSYYLQAQRITDRPNVPATVSAVQFVQVKPFRDDIAEQSSKNKGMTAEQQDMVAKIGGLKVAQLRLLKENFTLAHAEIGHDVPEWKQENQRVGGEQGLLETKAGVALDAMIKAGAPAQIVDLITQAKPLIGAASKKIIATQNEPALPDQGKALADITEVEKYIHKVIMHAPTQPGKPEQQTPDPFAKQRDVVLKQRAKTQAGEMELLAQEQQRLADDLAKNKIASDAPAPGTAPDPSKITGTPAERQTQVSQRVDALLNGQDFDADTTGHLEKTHESALASLHQLDADDPAAAREPAAAAAQELQAAIDAMNRAGQEKAQQQMAADLRIMNEAAEQARNAPAQQSRQQAQQAAEKAAQQAEQVRKDLANAAQQQQETGSTAQAARMAALANALNDKKLRDQLAKLKAAPQDKAAAENAAQHLDDLASRMQPQRPPGGPTQAQIASLIDRMQRAQLNLARLAQMSPPQPPTPGLPPAGMPQPGIPQPAQGQPAGAAGQPGQKPSAMNQPGQPGAQHQPGGQQGQQGQATAGAKGGQQNGAGGDDLTGAEKPDENHRASGGGHDSDNSQAQFTRSLVEQIADDTDVSASYLPNSPTIMQARTRVQAVASTVLKDNHPTTPVIAYGRLSPDLNTIISLLQAQLAQSGRQHELSDQLAEQAPPAYRAAVADYFERLSRDYQPAQDPPAK
jgi:hypothetical protein